MKTAVLQPRIVNAMTIDVEDYFHANAFDRVVKRDQWDRLESRVVANTERLLAILDAAAVRATFFVLGWVGERHPALVRRIAAQGHEIGSHSYHHRLLYEMTMNEFREDLRRTKAVLEAEAQAPVFGFRAPSYSITERSLWALDVLAEEGYVYDASVFPIRHDRYGIPSSPRHAYLVERNGLRLLEIPGSTARCGTFNLPVGGGGYFRLFPYSVTQWGIRRMNRCEQRPVVFYIHPWELDPGQPRLPVSAVTRWRHYHNLGQTEQRFRRLLSDFRFDSVSAVLLDSPVGLVTARSRRQERRSGTVERQLRAAFARP